jgi:SAM-dependent methyltransferase
MSDVHPTQRFTHLSEVYARSRPDYPAACVDFILDRAALDETTLLVDVGCGTGISTRLFAARGIPVVGIEPNDAMRGEAEAVEGPKTLRYLAGTADATGLPDACAAAVLSAQAFHWFDAARALAEFHRILRPGGQVALIWNERDETDPATAAYGAVVRTTAEARGVEDARTRAGHALLECPLFENGIVKTFKHEQVLDEDGVVGRARSISYAPKEPKAAAQFEAEIRRVFGDFQQNGRIILHYETSLYLARMRTVNVSSGSSDRSRGP